MNKIEILSEILSKPSDGSLPEISVFFDSEMDAEKALFFISKYFSNLNSLTGLHVEANAQVNPPPLYDFDPSIKDGSRYDLILENSSIRLGLYVFKREYLIDFRTGGEWSHEEAELLYNFLRSIKVRVEGVRIRLDVEEIFFSPKDRELFQTFFN